jgi:hypothetical protein
MRNCSYRGDGKNISKSTGAAICSREQWYDICERIAQLMSLDEIHISTLPVNE